MSADSRTEKWIEGFGVGWQYLPAVPLKHIDFERSRRNRGRPEAIKRALVDEYTLAMIDGSDFPAITVYQSEAKPGNGRFVIVDGNHRAQAAEAAERESVDAYLLLTDDRSLVDFMTIAANREGGERTSEDYGLAEGAQLVGRYGLSVVEVSRRLHISQDRLHKLLYASEARKRAEKLGLPATKLSDSTMVVLGRINNDPAFGAAVKGTADYSLPSEEAAELSKVVRTQRSEQSMLDAVTTFLAGRPTPAPGTNGSAPRRREMPVSQEFFQRARRLLELVQARPLPSQLQLTTRKEIEKAIEQAVRLGSWAERFKRDAEHELDR